MDLKSGYPYWALKTGLAQTFPPLAADATCDVAIVGGGISGALIARELAAHGHDVVLLERRDAAWGSTAASTALLQYEIDTHLVDLAEQYGERSAALAYRACADAVGELRSIAKDARGCGFAGQDSLYFASRARDVPGLRDECALRAKHGLPARWLDPAPLRERYGIDAPGAILSTLGARVDPYRLTLGVLAKLRDAGVRVHDRCCVAGYVRHARGIELRLTSGLQVRAAHVVVAAGYESQRWLPERVAVNRSSYAWVSDPLPRARLGVFARTLLWESARPYFYLRSTSDGRVLVGGKDDAIDVPLKRDLSIPRKVRKLRRRLAELRPELVEEVAFAWAGTFAETEDGLPWFGAHPATGPRIFYAMAYGGNGITYSAAGAGLLRALIERRAHPLQRIFGFARRQR